jgi:hypothetical protein
LIVWRVAGWGRANEKVIVAATRPRLCERTASRKKFERTPQLWLVAKGGLCEQLAACVALLGEEVRARVTLMETDEARETLTPVEAPRLKQLLDAAPRVRVPFAPPRLSETAARLVALAPDCVDAIRASHGGTLRFRGLSFACVRCLPAGQRVWFGPPGARQKILLDEDNWPRLIKL